LYFEADAKAFKSGSIKDYLVQIKHLNNQEIIDAAKNINIQVGSIVEAEGVIHDPAGSAVGGSFFGAGGLSGAIYKKFNKLKPIPRIPSGASIFNSSKDNQAKRILHTYSPHLSVAKNIEDVIDLLTNAYYGAVKRFVEDQQQHSQNQLNLSAISASIYAGSFTRNFDGIDHLDPTITLVSITAAIVKLKQENPDYVFENPINLFYLGAGPKGTYDTLLSLKARNTLEELQAE
jgi:hypothetical protein